MVSKYSSYSYQLVILVLLTCFRSSDFRPSFAHINELRAFVPSGTPLMVVTATVTKDMRKEVIVRLEMKGCRYVFRSPNKPNIMYSVQRRTTIEKDLGHILEDVRANSVKAKRVIVYCRSLNLCSSLYAHFLYELKCASYYPPGAEEISDNRLFGMFHSNTPDHNKEVIMNSMSKEDGTVRVVFATSALGMGVDFAGLNATVHYGAPRSIEDYFQESGRASRSGQQATSTIFWSPADVPIRKDLSKVQSTDLAKLRRYLENVSDCRRCTLLSHFDTALVGVISDRDRSTCCDNCNRELQPNLHVSILSKSHPQTQWRSQDLD